MFNLFKKENVDVNALENKIKDLTKDRKKLTEEVETLKLKKKIEDEDIKHMVKMATEKNEIEHERKCLQNEREKEKKIAEVREEYAKKAEAKLEDQIESGNKVYAELLKRLPDVNVALKGHIG